MAKQSQGTPAIRFFDMQVRDVYLALVRPADVLLHATLAGTWIYRERVFYLSRVQTLERALVPWPQFPSM